MYFSYFSRDELAELGLTIEDKFDDKNKFETILINGTDIRKVIDERNVKFTFSSLSKLTKENSRTNIMQNLGPILQYAGNQIEMEEIVKILLGLDFDPLKVVKKQEPQQPGQMGQQY